MNPTHHDSHRTVHAGEPKPQGQQFSVHTVIIALRCWWKIAAPLGILLAVGAAAGVYYFDKPTFTAAAWVLIRDRRDFILTQLETEDPRKYVNNQLELMRSPPVLEPVASNEFVASTPEIAKERDPHQALRKLLKFRSLGQSDFFVIEFTSVSPDRAALVVNEVANAYLDLQQGTESERFQRTIQLLRQQLNTQQVVVKELRENLQEMSKRLTGKDPFGVNQGNHNTVTLHNPLVELQTKLVAAEVEYAILQAQVQAETEMLKGQTIEPAKTDVERHVEAHPEVQTLRARLAAASPKLKEYEKTGKDAKYLQTNVLYQQLLKQVKEDEAALTKLLDEQRLLVKAEMEKFAKAAQEDRVAGLQRQLAGADYTMTLLKTRLQEGMKNQVEYKGETLDLEFARSDYERASRVYEAISARIIPLEMEQQAPARVSFFREAKPPTSPDEAKPYKKMGMAALVALFVPFGLAVGIEHLYRRVSSRQQLESAGRITVVGEVTALPKRIKSRKKNETANRDVQLFEESIDGVRTYLTLVESLRGLKVLAVTSAVSREGKTSLAAQLAVSIAAATGEKTLLIDGDMRSPDVHKIFDVELGPGLADVLKGECPIEEAIETGFSETLHLLTAGSLSTSPHRLLGNGEFSSLLAALAGTYRYVIVDTAPVLPASETLIMTRAADATVVCVRRDFSRVDQVSEALHRLQTAGVKTAGAVLNGIPAKSYTYKYGSYYYSRSRFEAADAEPASSPA